MPKVKGMGWGTGWGGGFVVILMPALPIHQAPPPPKRAPTTALTLRSKSMTAELEELGKATSPCCPQPMHGLLLAGLSVPRPCTPYSSMLGLASLVETEVGSTGMGLFRFLLI